MPFDIVALAKRINLRREEFNAAHRQRLRITSAMSRILENDPEYVPYRRRAGTKKRRPAQNPSIRTLVEIASRLETTVGDLLGELTIPPLTPVEREKLRAALRSLEKLR